MKWVAACLLAIALVLPDGGSARAAHGGGGGGGHGGGAGAMGGRPMGGGWHGHGSHGGWGWYNHHPGFRSFVFFDPFFFPSYLPYPYPYPYYTAAPYWPDWPPPDDQQAYQDPNATPGQAPPPPEDDATESTSDESRTATYGLLQLRGVPDGARVDLDGRFWLEGANLDRRWLAVPEGEHTLSVRVGNRDPVERRITVQAGKNVSVRFGLHAENS